MAYAAAEFAGQETIRLLYHSLPPPIRDPLLRSEMENIARELSFLRPVLKAYTDMEGNKLRVDPLEEQIEHTIDRFMDLIESHMLSLSSSSAPGAGLLVSGGGGAEDVDGVNDYASILSQELRKIRQDISSLTKELENKLDRLHSSREEDEEDYERNLGQSLAADDIVSSSRIYHPDGQDGNEFLVGLDDELTQLVDRIMGSSDGKLRLTSLFGMAGIGKTTLVKQLYNHPSVLTNFNTRIMVTIGPNFQFREFLLLVLHHLEVDVVERLEKLGNEELKLRLGKFLEGKKCLIVLDDVWDIDILLNLIKLLIGERNGSRIILTTRLYDIAPDENIHAKSFLNDERSWDLLHGIVFTNLEERCNRELEKIGKQIAKNCEGLPLAIVLVAKLLCENPKTVEYWKKVSEDENPLNIGIDENTHISKSLYLSYKMLPLHLKACFLYVGVFPKSYKNTVSSLIRLWVAEGFLTPGSGITIEGVAWETLAELTHKSVVLIHELSSLGGIKTCRVHTIFKSLCIGVAQKEEFCQVMKKYLYSFPRGTCWQPRLCIHNNVIFSIKEVRSTLESIQCVRTLLCFGPLHAYPLHVDLSRSSLLRVLDALRIRFYMFPDQILELLRLRYLALMYDGELPKSISNLWKLQVLIVGRHWNIKSLNAPSYLPMEIWNLKWLKHIQCTGTDLQDHCRGSDGCEGSPMLKYLVTLSDVGRRSCTQGVLKRLPNLKKLGIRIELAPDEIENFNFFKDVALQLQRLQSFKCVISGLSSQIIPMTPILPSNILKITLSGCRFPWEYMTAIGILPRLRVRKLRCHAFHGFVWEPIQGEFLCLKYLLLEDLAIKEWRVHHNHFSNLEHLIIRHCYKLHEISSDVGNINTLRTIEVKDCQPSLGISAEQIKAEINSCLDVCIYSSIDEDN